VEENYPFDQMRPSSNLYNEIQQSFSAPEMRFFADFIIERLFEGAPGNPFQLRDQAGDAHDSSSQIQISSVNGVPAAASLALARPRKEIEIVHSEFFDLFKKFIQDGQYKMNYNSQQFSFQLGHSLRILKENEGFYKDRITKREMHLQILWKFDVAKTVAFLEHKGLVSTDKLEFYRSFH
jgi:hypothetical protein